MRIQAAAWNKGRLVMESAAIYIAVLSAPSVFADDCHVHTIGAEARVRFARKHPPSLVGRPETGGHPRSWCHCNSRHLRRRTDDRMCAFVQSPSLHKRPTIVCACQVAMRSARAQCGNQLVWHDAFMTCPATAWKPRVHGIGCGQFEVSSRARQQGDA
jgi:hypothetical protein